MTIYCTMPEKAPHSSTLAWKIPGTEEPGRLQSMGSQRVGHDWATSLSLFPFMHWRRKWQPTPVFLPGESQGRGSLVGCRLWGRTESDTTEATQQRQQQQNFKAFKQQTRWKTALRTAENICKWSNYQGINLQNTQTAHAAQHQEIKPPNKKMGRR